MDFVGRFPILSRGRNRYIFVYYNKDINAILSKTFKNCSEGVMGVAHNKILNIITKGGFKPDFNVIDNNI